MSERPFACSLTDADLVRGCAPEQPDEVEPGQNWMNVETGETYPVGAVRDDVIQKDDRLVRLGTGSYVILLSESDLRERYVCTDSPRPVSGSGAPSDHDEAIAASARDSGLRPLGKDVICRLFARRHESLYARELARESMKNARLMLDWRRARG